MALPSPVREPVPQSEIYNRNLGCLDFQHAYAGIYLFSQDTIIHFARSIVSLGLHSTLTHSDGNCYLLLSPKCTYPDQIMIFYFAVFFPQLKIYCMVIPHQHHHNILGKCWIRTWFPFQPLLEGSFPIFV